MPMATLRRHATHSDIGPLGPAGIRTLWISCTAYGVVKQRNEHPPCTGVEGSQMIHFGIFSKFAICAHMRVLPPAIEASCLV